MPKRRRLILPNSIHHIVNRGNDKKVIFPEPVDYGSFLALLREARERFEVELYAYCLMPNHFHLVVRVASLAAISAYMHYVQCLHACDLRRCDRSRGHGHIFQRRYWNKPVGQRVLDDGNEIRRSEPREGGTHGLGPQVGVEQHVGPRHRRTGFAPSITSAAP